MWHKNHPYHAIKVFAFRTPFALLQQIRIIVIIRKCSWTAEVLFDVSVSKDVGVGYTVSAPSAPMEQHI